MKHLKQHLLSLFVALMPALSLAQVSTDTLKVVGIGSHTIDSLNEKLSSSGDAARLKYFQLDSIRTEFNATVDSLHDGYQKTIAELNAKTKKIDHTIDSLEELNLRANKYKRRLRKLSEIRQKAEAQFTYKLNALKKKTTDKLNALDLPPEYKEHLQKISQQIDEITLNSDVIKLPELDIPGYDIPSLNSISNASSLEGLTNGTDIPQLPNVQPPAQISNVTQQMQGYEGDLDKIANADITNTEALQKTVESQASEVDGIDELQKQSGVIDAHKTKLGDLADPDKGKKKAVELARKAAVDHFAGKQEQLKAAMEKISKYKQKYSSVSSIKDLPKRPPNAMKGKPLIERLTPGLYFQYQQKNVYLVDVNPYIGYKISGRFTAGVGWNHRFAYDKRHRNFNSRSKIFGPRAYLDVKLGKGFIAHLEGECMNTFVPSTIAGNPDTGQREWVWSFMTGLKKEYKIYKNLKGTALIQYNWFNRYYKAPYVDRLNSRIGFEYILKK